MGASTMTASGRSGTARRGAAGHTGRTAALADSLYFQDVAAQVEIPTDGIISRTLRADEAAKVVVFGFDRGQELSEHTASVPAIVHVLSGEGDLTLGADARPAGPGTWAYMPAHMPHSVVARTPLVMLLVMLTGAREL